MSKNKTKSLQIMLTETDYCAVLEAAQNAGMTVSQFGAKIVLGSVLQTGTRGEEATLDAIKSFRGLFCDAMELSLIGKLTPERLRGLAETKGIK